MDQDKKAASPKISPDCWIFPPLRCSTLMAVRKLFIELEGVQEGNGVGSFFVGEDESQMSLVVVDHVLKRRGDAVVEVRRVRGESPKCRRLEFAEVVPEPGDVATACIGQLPDLARSPVPEGVQGQVRGTGLGRRGTDVVEDAVDVCAVVC